MKKTRQNKDASTTKPGRNTLPTIDPFLRSFRDRLSLPLIAAPMFLVSGVELVVAACRNGVIGSFPTVNCRSPEQLDEWLSEIESRLHRHADRNRKTCRADLRQPDRAPLQCDGWSRISRCYCDIEPEMVITSVGSPAPVLKPLHDAGAIVFADVASYPPRRARGRRRRRRAGAVDGRRRRPDRLAQSVRVRTRGTGVLSTGRWCSPAASATATRCAPRRRSAATSLTWAPSSLPQA